MTGCGRRAEPLPVIKHIRVESGGYNVTGYVAGGQSLCLSSNTKELRVEKEEVTIRRMSQ